MAESNQISRKRMRFSSSSSATEILTRSKSLNQTDCSVRFAPAASHAGSGFRVPHSSSLCGKIDSKIVRSYSRVSIKDLRLRRVFSPNLISSDWKYKTKGEKQTTKQDEEFPCRSHISNSETAAKEGIIANAEAEEILQTTPPDSEILSNEFILSVNEAERISEKIDGLAVKKSGTNLFSKSVLHPCSRSKIFKNPGSFSYKRLLPYLMQAADEGTSAGGCSKPEKSFDQNPPKVNLFSNKETQETAEDSKEEVSELMTARCQLPETTKPVLQSVDRGLTNQSAVRLCGNTSPLKKVVASSPNKKSLCSRRKLFKTPGSVNYRRMLPYLRDIQEDNHCMPETVNHPDHPKSTDENTPSRIIVSENEGTLETATSNVVKESDTCSHDDKEPLPCERVPETPGRSDLEKEQEPQVKHVIPDTEKNLETPRDVFATEAPLSPPFVDSRNSSEVASSALNNTFDEKLADKENMNGSEKTEPENSVEQLQADGSSLTTELLDHLVVETPSSISPSKGILKRSIRGCRGICSCLNCSSFRLNAERAFEFSRNQLQDTEVMVLDLVGEISHLRAMLEKHDSADHNESYKIQAGEAAKRASEAGELAKSRLHQMNDDLQVHCRIPNEQRARVKFAHYVHEKTILKASET